ncbi:carboxypeptidase regulatory-like domain-containing protein [Pedobacter sp. N23S346]|uniref:carboxypeptidase regulatory-like domain-containing protein n=1 Tax=Pedobacter sp. N23S346 TaxID=3402750 RepID=UPI003AD149CF
MKPILRLSICIFIFQISAAKAQNKPGSISGTILNELHKPVTASVKISTANDSSSVKVVSTNENGKFYFDHLMSGKYDIEISALGYILLKSSIQISDSLKNVVNDFVLKASENNLGSVTIATKKPVIERFNDRIVMNIENSLVSTGNNALEILAKMPGVSVNQEGTISVHGNLVLIF